MLRFELPCGACLESAAKASGDGSEALTLVFPDDQGYEDARRVNHRFNPLPLAVVYAKKAQHVQAAVACGRTWHVPVSPASGRHSYQGMSVQSGGLTVDLSNMTQIDIDVAKGEVLVGPGVTGGMLTTALHFEGPPGAVFPTGVCPWVGVSGFTLGGGISLLGRFLGLGCDQLLGLEMVTAAGELIVASKANNTDLLWASCGGGGGSFGIVTQFKFSLRTLPDNGSITQIIMSFSPGVNNTVAAFERFQDWMPGMDRRFGAFIDWSSGAMHLNLVFIGRKDEARKHVEASGLLELPMDDGGPTFIQLPSYWNWLKISSENIWLLEPPPDVTDVDEWRRKVLRGEPGYRVNHGGYSAKWWLMSQTHMTERLPKEAVQKLAEYMVQMSAKDSENSNWGSCGVGTTCPSEMPSKLSQAMSVGLASRWMVTPANVSAFWPTLPPKFNIWFWVLGGVISDVAPSDTAFFNRNSWFVVEGSLQLNHMKDELELPTADEAAGYISIVNRFAELLDPYLPTRKPGYVNYLNPPAATWREGYWGDNYPRLQEVKERYDPLGVFFKPQTVEPAPPAASADLDGHPTVVA